MTPPTISDPVSTELHTILRTLKLDKLVDTLPERLTSAHQQHQPHDDFLRLLLADEVARRDSRWVTRCIRKSGLDPRMRIDTWDPTSAVRYDRQLWAELTSLRLVDDPYGAVILGPTGVGKTHLATALGHLACSRRRSVLMVRTDKLLKQLKAARLDNTVDAKMRRLTRVELLILDDFALQPLDTAETTDIHQIIIERYDEMATVIISNREPNEWLAMMAEPLLARSAVDRLVSAAHELVLEGASYRRLLKPGSRAAHQANTDVSAEHRKGDHQAHPPAGRMVPEPGQQSTASPPETDRTTSPAQGPPHAESIEGGVPPRSGATTFLGVAGNAGFSADGAHPARPNGAAVAAVIAAGIGSAVFGSAVVSTEASTAIKNSLTLNAGVGSLSGKSMIGAVGFLLAWLVLHLILRQREVPMRLTWWLTAVPLTIGLALTFPPLFQLFAPE